MPRKDFNDKAHGLLEVLAGKTESVFSKRFKTYLFFDLDIRSDAVLIGAVKENSDALLGTGQWRRRLLIH